MARLSVISRWSFSKFVVIAVVLFPCILFGQDVAGVTPYEYAVFSRFVYNARDLSLPDEWRIFKSYVTPLSCLDSSRPFTDLTMSIPAGNLNDNGVAVVFGRPVCGELE